MTSTEAVNSVDSSSKTDFKNVLALAKARAEALKTEKRRIEEVMNSFDPKRPSVMLDSQYLGLGFVTKKDVLIPNVMAGLVIGKNGETIKKIQAESGARVQVATESHDGGNNRYVYVAGTEEQIRKAEVVIREVIDPPSSSSGHITEKLGVRADRVGLVIGKGGLTLRDLQERSGARISVIQELVVERNEKDVQITGTPECVHLAKQLIYNLVAAMDGGIQGVRPATIVNQYGTPVLNQVEKIIPRSFVGLVIGQKGATIKKLQMDTGAMVQMGPDNLPDTRALIISGTPQQIQAAQAQVDLLLQGNSLGTNGEEFKVPIDKVGLVIGTKGDTIKAIQQQSGARVQLIQEAPPNSPYKIFILQGTPQQLASAKALIMEKVTGMVGAQPAYPLSPWPQQAYQQSPQAFPQYAQQQQYAYAAYTQYPQQVQSPQSWNGQYVQPSAAAAMQTQQPPTPSQQAYYAQAPSQSPMPQSQGVNGYGAGGDLGTPGQHSQESLQSQDPNQSLSASAEEATLDGSLSAVGELTLEQQWQNWYAWQAYYAQQGITSAQPQQQQQYTTSAGYYQPQAQQQTDSLPPPPPPSV